MLTKTVTTFLNLQKQLLPGSVMQANQVNRLHYR